MSIRMKIVPEGQSRMDGARGISLADCIAGLCLIAVALATIAVTSLHAPLASPFVDLMQEGEYVAPLLYFAEPRVLPMLIHGLIDYLPSMAAADMCGIDRVIACTRAINQGVSAFASCLFALCLLATAWSRAQILVCAVAFTLLLLAINGQTETPIALSQGSPGVRDVWLLLVCAALMWAGRVGGLPANMLVLLAGLVAGASVFWAYNRGITACVVVGAYAGAQAFFMRDWRRPSLAALGLLGGLALAVGADPAMAMQHIRNIVHWGTNGEIWHIPIGLRALPYYVAAGLVCLWGARSTVRALLGAAPAAARRCGVPVVAALTVACIFIVQQTLGRSDKIHLDMMLPWLFLLYFSLMERHPAGAEPGGWISIIRHNARSAIAVGALFVLMFAWPAAENYKTMRANMIDIAAGGLPDNRALAPKDVLAVAEELAASQSHCTYTLNNGGGFYLLSGLRPCSSIMYPVYASREAQAKIIADLARARPALVVGKSDDWFSAIDQKSLRQRTPELARWVDIHYPHVVRIGAIELRARRPATPASGGSD